MKKSLGNSHGTVFVLSGPAGTGKTTLVRMLVDEFPNIVQSISFTTREPRQGELSGVDYNFITDQEFESKILKNEFLEYVKLYGYYYGTSRNWVEKTNEQGKYVILVIDTQGALQLMKKIQAVFIFVEPPTLEELRMRLIHRQTESDDGIVERLAWAKKEIKEAHKYNYRIVNKNLEDAYDVLRSIIIAEQHRVSDDV
jgi:guanylate kinase